MINDIDSESSPAKTNAGGFNKWLLASVILGFAALVIYQAFFCATCYGPSIQ